MWNYIRKLEQAKVYDVKAETQWQEGGKRGQQVLPWEGVTAQVPEGHSSQLYPQHAKFLLSVLRAFPPQATLCAIVMSIDFAANRYLFVGFRPCLP